MLGRRSLRVKTMQVLYGYEMNNSLSLLALEQQLERTIEKTVSLYLAYLVYLNELAQYSLVDAAIRLAKFIKTEEDKNTNTHLAASPLLKNLFENDTWNAFLAKHKTQALVDKEIVKSLFNQLKTKQRYKDFCANNSPSVQQQNELLVYIVKKILADNDLLESVLEEHFGNFDDDSFLLLHLLQKQLESLKEDANPAILIEAVQTWNAEQRFPLELLKQYHRHHEDITKIIEPNLKNWDLERIAILDMTLMKLAVCEMLYMPTVPVKVSINEYIDISKIYSTPKSKDFVNGVLDKIKFQLIESGQIKKQGRGLVE